MDSKARASAFFGRTKEKEALSPLLWHQYPKDEQHKLPPMHNTTVPRPISRILFELTAFFAPWPYGASYEMFLSSNLTKPVLQVTSCIVWQWADLFFPITFAVITVHVARAKASNCHSASSQPVLAGGTEEV